MSRVLAFAFLTLGLSSAAAPAGDVVVAPAPRESGRKFVPEATRSQNPQETVDRIIKNSKAVGDKLAMKETGKETQKSQDEILRDIQSLIDQQENPPPPKPDQNPDMNKDNKDQQKDKQSKDKDDQPNHPNGKGDQPPPMGGKGGMGDMQPMGGSQPSPMGGSGDSPQRKPRQGTGQAKTPEKAPGDAQANPSSGGASQNAAHAKPKDPGSGGIPPPNNQRPPTAATVPPETMPVKDVWGYLPDKLRQQAMQYYKQEFVPKYAKLLEHYYSSLAEKDGKK